jgi:hypothetical protein
MNLHVDVERFLQVFTIDRDNSDMSPGRYNARGGCSVKEQQNISEESVSIVFTHSDGPRKILLANS